MVKTTIQLSASKYLCIQEQLWEYDAVWFNSKFSPTLVSVLLLYWVEFG